MDLQSQLIESSKRKGESRWKCRLASLGIHGAIVALIVFMGASATHKVDAEEKPLATPISRIDNVVCRSSVCA